MNRLHPTLLPLPVLGLILYVALALDAAGARAAQPATSACPLDIVPGRALGPVALGDPVGPTGRAPAETDFVEVGPVHARTCGGQAVDVWLDDLRVAPACVTLSGRPLDRTVTLDALRKRFGDCRDLPPRIGGAFIECAGGGVRFGYGLGTFLQVRVARPGGELDDECADLADDGSPVPLPVAERDALLQQVLDHAALAPFWHPDHPGRRPLRLETSGALAPGDAPAFMLMGAPVALVDAAASGAGPVFRFTALKSSAQRVTIAFAYPVEGVVGTAQFRRRLGTWRLEGVEVGER